nr:helix-turn-helix domain-containing protein [Nocardioidaceae bacterium]
RWARRHADMSQRQLARWSGVPKSTIADIESGRRRARLDTAERLLGTMGLQVGLAWSDDAPLETVLADRRCDRGGRLVPPHLDVRERCHREIQMLTIPGPPGAGTTTASPITWRRDRDVREVLRCYGYFGDFPHHDKPVRAMNLSPPGRLVDLWFRGWPYDHELEYARPDQADELSEDFTRDLRAALAEPFRPSPPSAPP